jgi:hypothetical protein
MGGGRGGRDALCEVQNTKYSHSSSWLGGGAQGARERGTAYPLMPTLTMMSLLLVSLGSAHARDVREWKLCEPRVCGSYGHSPH